MSAKARERRQDRRITHPAEGRKESKRQAERTKRIRERLTAFYGDFDIMGPKPTAQDTPGTPNGKPDDVRHGGKS